MTEHVTWLVPVRVDSDGTQIVPCPGLDGGVLDVDFWALWCADCSAIASEPVVGSVGVQTVEGLPYDAEAYEHIYGRIHAHALADGVPASGTVRFGAGEVARYAALRPHETATAAAAGGLLS